jgi:hypothetical protein
MSHNVRCAIEHKPYVCASSICPNRKDAGSSTERFDAFEVRSRSMVEPIKAIHQVEEERPMRPFGT